MMIHLTSRYLFYHWKTSRRGRRVIMDYFNAEKAKQIYGAPIGGIGSGTIGRGFSGEFCRFQLRPGMYEYNTVLANQFIVTIKDVTNKTLFQSLLSSYSRPNKDLISWRSDINPEVCDYTGLYPRAWTEIDLSEYGIKLICRQISPVIPHNYKDSSLPCAIFVWTVENVSEEDRKVSLSFTFKNGTGTKKQDRAGNPTTKAFESNLTKGVAIKQTITDMQCTYNLASLKKPGVNITHCTQFDPKGDGTGLWDDLFQNGRFTKEIADEKLKKSEVGVGLCADFLVKSRQQQDVEFVLVWDMPKVHFPKKLHTHHRFYSKYFGADGNAGPKICDYAVENFSRWEQEIFRWQDEVLSDR